jgi:hypothetical protein
MGLYNDALSVAEMSRLMRSGALFLGVKRQGRQADHSPPSSAEVENVWSCTSTPPYVFRAWCLIKHSDNLTFTLTFHQIHKLLSVE